MKNKTNESFKGYSKTIFRFGVFLSALSVITMSSIPSIAASDQLSPASSPSSSSPSTSKTSQLPMAPMGMGMMGGGMLGGGMLGGGGMPGPMPGLGMGMGGSPDMASPDQFVTVSPSDHTSYHEVEYKCSMGMPFGGPTDTSLLSNDGGKIFGVSAKLTEGNDVLANGYVIEKSGLNFNTPVTNISTVSYVSGFFKFLNNRGNKIVKSIIPGSVSTGSSYSLWFNTDKKYYHVHYCAYVNRLNKMLTKDGIQRPVVDKLVDQSGVVLVDKKTGMHTIDLGNNIKLNIKMKKVS